MKNLLQKLAFITFPMLFIGCPFYKGYDYPTGHFPENPTNLSELNTEFNDYNISSPTIYSETFFHFSSDRNSSGVNYDIVGENIAFEWSKGNGTFQCYSSESNYSQVVSDVLQIINTSDNELGPYSLFYMSEDNALSFLMFFSRQTNGSLDNFYINAIQSNNQSWTIGSVRSCKSINSNTNDGYVTILGTGLRNQMYGYGNSLSAIQKAIFCSDRAGQFDIYEIPIPSNINALSYIAKDTLGLESIITALSSTGDDKCPYVNDDIIVFASNRDGGLGGFDLYYSRNNNGTWTEPINLGNKVNSQHDEYRPIIMSYGEYDNDVIFFSSNRPGGIGLYDIYYCGIPSLIDAAD